MASGLKAFWPDKDQPIDTPGLSGASVTSSGSDPNADGGDGPAGLDPVWEKAPYDTTSTAESSNSVSGLPALPNRFEPAADTVELPTLKDRMPGTIDKQ